MANIDETIRKLEEKSKPVPTPVSKEPEPPEGPQKQTVTSFHPLSSDECPLPDAAKDDARSQRPAWEAESVRERNEPPMSDPPKPDEKETFDDLSHAREEGPSPEPEEFPGLFDNRQTETLSDVPPSPAAPSSGFWADFFDGILLPPLWGIDLVLILISLTGLGWIALHWSMVFNFFTYLVYTAISSAFMPLLAILLFLLTLGVIVAALRGMCASCRFC